MFIISEIWSHNQNSFPEKNLIKTRLNLIKKAFNLISFIWESTIIRNSKCWCFQLTILQVQIVKLINLLFNFSSLHHNHNCQPSHLLLFTTIRMEITHIYVQKLYRIKSLNKDGKKPDKIWKQSGGAGNGQTNGLKKKWRRKKNSKRRGGWVDGTGTEGGDRKNKAKTETKCNSE